jgi:hypothetical protein
MANRFGDVLRNLGSVLNPQVAQEMGQEDRLEQQQAQQIGMLGLQRRFQMEDQKRQRAQLEASPQYQLQMEALKNERGFRDAVKGAGGDETKIASAAMEFGKPEIAMQIVSKREARQTQLEIAREKIASEERQLQARLEDRSASREQLAVYQQGLLALKGQSAALQAEIARGNQDLRRLQFETKADAETRKQVQQLSVGLEKANLPQADAVLANVESAIRKNAAVAEYISGPKSNVPDWMVPDDVKTARQDFQKLFNITLKDRSGAAVTNQELERLKSEFATGTFKSAKQLNDAVEKARGIISKHYAGIAAGFGPETLKAYNENIRGMGGRVVIEPTGANPTAPGAGQVLKFDAQGNPIP